MLSYLKANGFTLYLFYKSYSLKVRQIIIYKIFISFMIYFTKIIFGGVAFLFNNSATGHFSIIFFLMYPPVFFKTSVHFFG